jgi:hypothetical protein
MICPISEKGVERRCWNETLRVFRTNRFTLRLRKYSMKRYVPLREGSKMRNKNLAIIAISLGVLALLALLWVGNVLAGPPMQGPEGGEEGEVTAEGEIEAQAIMDDGFWYQGQLTDGDGNPLANTDVNVTFRLYDVSVGGVPLDTNLVAVNTDSNGLFNEEVDFNNPDLFDGRALYLGLQVDGEASEMTPRQYLRVVPYAMSIRPGAVISTGSSASAYDPVLEIHHSISSTSDLDGLHVYVESEGEAIEGRSKYGKGVYGSTEDSGTTGDAGVYGYAYGDTPGVRGHSLGDSDNSYGGYFTSANRRGLYAESGGNYYAGYFWGNGPSGVGIYVYGDIAASGDKTAVVQAGDYGVRKMYSMESPNVWFEDLGQGQLASGQATVVIEPMFRSTINTEVPYHVFVTPLGDCNGLYVTNDYRIVAIRKGYEKVRMELLTEGGKPMEVGPPTPSGEPEPEDR